MTRNYAIVINLGGNMLVAARKGWYALRDKFHVEYISSRSSCPHITLSAGNCTLPETDVVGLVKEIAAGVRSFEISGRGLGIFVLETPLVYVRWVLSGELNDLYAMFQGSLKGIWGELETSYSPEMWLPKTTLAFRDISYDQLPKVLAELQKFEFAQPMLVQKLSLLAFGEQGESLIETIQI